MDDEMPEPIRRFFDEAWERAENDPDFVVLPDPGPDPAEVIIADVEREAAEVEAHREAGAVLARGRALDEAGAERAAFKVCWHELGHWVPVRVVRVETGWGTAHDPDALNDWQAALVAELSALTPDE